MKKILLLLLLACLFASCEKPYEAPASYVSQSTTIPTTFEAGMFDPSVDQVVQVRVPVKFKTHGGLGIGGVAEKRGELRVSADFVFGGTHHPLTFEDASVVTLNASTVGVKRPQVIWRDGFMWDRRSDSNPTSPNGSAYALEATILIPAGTIQTDLLQMDLTLMAEGDTRWNYTGSVSAFGAFSIELQPDAEIVIRREGADDQTVTPTVWATVPVSSI